MNRQLGRNALTAALNEQLFPEIRHLGFAGPKLERVEIDDVDPPEEAQLYHFRRSLPSGGEVVLAVDVKSFARPTFRLIAGHVPVQGVRLVSPDEIVPPDNVTAEMLQEQAILQASPREAYAPFRQPLWAFVAGSTAGIRESVQRAVELLPQLVAWLETGAPSKHVWVLRFPRAAAAASLPDPPG